jgi:Skp family chaperone for outer membrane proteins
MKKAIVACAACALAGLWMTAAPAGETKRIGVVNVSNVFRAYLKVQDVQKVLKTRFEAQRAELEKERKELADAMSKFQVEQGQQEMSKEAFLKYQQLQLRDFELKERVQGLAKKIEEARMEEMRQVLKEIRATIREVGQAENFDLILRAPEYDEQGNPLTPDEENPEQTPKNATELVRRFRENPVLYFATGVNITDQVTSKLNAEYQKRGGSGGTKAGVR